MVAASQGDSAATCRLRTALLVRRATDNPMASKHESNRIARSDLPAVPLLVDAPHVEERSLSVAEVARRGLRPSMLTVGRRFAPSARPNGAEHPKWWWTAGRRLLGDCRHDPADGVPWASGVRRLAGCVSAEVAYATGKSPRCCGSASGLGRGRVGAIRADVNKVIVS